MNRDTIAIIGAGNIGLAMAEGLVRSGRYKPSQIVLTRRNVEPLEAAKQKGFVVEADNTKATGSCPVVIVAVEPQQLNGLLTEISATLEPSKHTIISVVSGVGIREITERIGKPIPVVRAMPNTAISIEESMTCLAANNRGDESLELARSIFDAVGKTLIIDEEQMLAATALCACGVAFFLRAIRAASQGGIEIGFHADEALTIAAQTAKGAASLLLSKSKHPEHEIDRVTTPRGCTISGLNQMEHEGFSSAMIKGITTSAEKVAQLYHNET